MNGRPFHNPLQLLRQGATAMQARMPIWSVHFKADGESYRARWDWPGVLTVSDGNSGELLAQSLPGKPTKPNAKTKARAALMGAE